MNMKTIKFYNGGDRVNERFSYTRPDEDHRVSNCVSYWVMDAPSKGFFEVPLLLQNDNGGTVFVNLQQELTDRYGERGFVKIDRDLEDEDCAKEVWLANSEKMAKQKGDAQWKVYCRKVIDAYEEENERRKIVPLPPLKPSNFVRHAYQELGLLAPGEEQMRQAGIQKSEVDEVKELLTRLTAILTPEQKAALAENK